MSRDEYRGWRVRGIQSPRWCTMCVENGTSLDGSRDMTPGQGAESESISLDHCCLHEVEAKLLSSLKLRDSWRNTVKLSREPLIYVGHDHAVWCLAETHSCCHPPTIEVDYTIGEYLGKYGFFPWMKMDKLNAKMIFSVHLHKVPENFVEMLMQRMIIFWPCMMTWLQ